MKMRKALLILGIVSQLSVSAWAQGYTIKTYAAPANARSGLGITGINNAGRMVGMYMNSNGVTLGVIIFPTGYKSFTMSGIKEFYPKGINNHSEISGSLLTSTSKLKAFARYSSGTIKVYGLTGSQYIQGESLNDLGVKAGVVQDGAGNIKGYTITQSGVVRIIEPPGAIMSGATGINNAGQIVGWYEMTTEDFHGYLLSDGTFTTLDYPGALYTLASSINNQGEVVGYYILPDFTTHSFIYSLAAGFQSFKVPDAPQTQASAINDNGVIVGSYSDGINWLGFVATPQP